MSIRRSPAMIPALCLGALGLVASACINVEETLLEHLADHVDKKNLADAGLSPRMVHPKGLSFDVSARHVVSGRRGENTGRAFFFEIEASNQSDAAVQLTWKKFYIRADDGQRFRASRLEYWDADAEQYRESQGEVPAGSKGLYVATMLTGKDLRLQHIIEICAHWSYVFKGRSHGVASRFRVD